MCDKRGDVLFNVVVVVVIFAVTAVLLYPVVIRVLDKATTPRASSVCAANVKGIATALLLYCADHDAVLPSSALRGASQWKRESFVGFATRRGGASTADVTWYTLLYPYLKNEITMWCPEDADAPPDSKSRDDPSLTVSYWYKAAVDRAWFGAGKWSCRHEKNFLYPAEQIAFYEREGRHWGNACKGLTDGVTINCAYLDGHVAQKRIQDSGQTGSAADPTAPGEPAWFNYDREKDKPLGIGEFFDGRRQGDALQ